MNVIRKQETAFQQPMKNATVVHGAPPFMKRLEVFILIL
jgi:hypothetical protein